MHDLIVHAIQNQFILEFHYDGGIRRVEPHCYGITTAGNHGLRGYQVSGYSSSGSLGWKMFDMSKSTSIIILEETFSTARTGYKRGDKGMQRIIAQL